MGKLENLTITGNENVGEMSAILTQVAEAQDGAAQSQATVRGHFDTNLQRIGRIDELAQEMSLLLKEAIDSRPNTIAIAKDAVGDADMGSAAIKSICDLNVEPFTTCKKLAFSFAGETGVTLQHLTQEGKELDSLVERVGSLHQALTSLQGAYQRGPIEHTKNTEKLGKDAAQSTEGVAAHLVR